MQYQKVYIKQFRLHVANKYLAFADRLTSRLTKKSMSSAPIRAGNTEGRTSLCNNYLKYTEESQRMTIEQRKSKLINLTWGPLFQLILNIPSPKNEIKEGLFRRSYFPPCWFFSKR